MNEPDTMVSIGEAARAVVERLAPHGNAMPAAIDQTSAIIHMIERVARDPSVDISRLERLLEMQERITARNAKAAFDAALAEMQPKLPIITRRGHIEVREKDGAGKRTGAVTQSTKYALWEDINEAIGPVLAAYGFALSFRTGLAADGRITVTGILSHREGHREETMMVLPHDSTGSKNAVQAIGSSTSYGKRYTAGALLNITSRGEDDDGQKGGDGAGLTQKQVDDLEALIQEVQADKAKFLAFMKAETLADIPAKQYGFAVDALAAKRKVRA